MDKATELKSDLEGYLSQIYNETTALALESSLEIWWSVASYDYIAVHLLHHDTINLLIIILL